MSSIPTDPNDPFAPEFIPAPPPPPRDQLSGHEYDGIQEYDNPTPGWWTAVFAVTVFFSFFYFVYYHGGVPERSLKDGARDLYGKWPTLPFEEKRKVTESIVQKVIVGKGEIDFDFCYLPSAEEMAKGRRHV